MPVDPHASVAAFAAIADRYPAFRVDYLDISKSKWSPQP
jgi:hypothetical protein